MVRESLGCCALLIAVLLIVSCSVWDLLFPSTTDSVPPVPGGSGTIVVGTATESSVQLSWAAAGDDETAAPSLLYLVVYSTADSIGTLAQALENGERFGTWTPGVTAVTVTGLVPDTRYYFNVAVSDAAGNKAIYAGATAVTASPDSDPPPSLPAVIDQQQSVIDYGAGSLAVGGSSDQKLAQVVTAGISGPLVAVDLPVQGSTGDLSVEITAATRNGPERDLIAASVFNESNMPTAGTDGFSRFAFESPVHVPAGTMFAIVLSSSGSCTVAQGPEGNPYPGGDGYYDSRPNEPGVWVRLGTRSDLPFRTVVSADVSHGVIEFDRSIYRVSEADGEAIVSVNRLMGSVGQVSVDYAATEGSATAGVDFGEVVGTLVWNDGDLSFRSFSVPIYDDAAVEPEKTVLLTLSGVTGGAVLRYPPIAHLIIEDDDVGEVVDQEQPIIDKSVGGLGIGGGGNQRLAQVVTSGIPGYLVAVKMPINGTSGDLVIEIQGVASEKPDGTVLTSETFEIGDFPPEDADGMRRFSFSTSVYFVSGARFAVVLRSDGSHGVFRGPIGDSYSGGKAYWADLQFDPDTWVELTGREDLPFKTLVSTE